MQALKYCSLLRGPVGFIAAALPRGNLIQIQMLNSIEKCHVDFRVLKG